MVFNTAAGVVAAATLSAADADVFESLLDDGPETFLYSFYTGYGNRFLGLQFRTDNGKASGYDWRTDVKVGGVVGSHL